MPLDQAQQSTLPIVQSSWSGGMITSLPPEELPDDAAALIFNFEFDDIANLRAREPSVSFASLPDSNVVSSLFYVRYTNGTEFFAWTSSTKLYTMTMAGVSTDRTGAFTFPNGTRWYWVMFDDFAIGVNGSGTERPIKITSAPAVTTLNASAPFAKHCVVWNDRLWLVGVGANSNTIYGSAINDPEDWTTTGDAGTITLGIDIGDGDKITALSVFRGNLFVYKEKSIHVVSAIAAPANIPANLRVDLHTRNFGTKHPLTIQNVLDDQLFLSRSGVVSLSLAPLGEIQGVILSDKIAEFSKFFPGDEGPNASPHSIVIKQKQQYWVAIPDGVVPNSISEYRVFVLDFSDITKRKLDGSLDIRWCLFDADVYGSAYTEIPSDETGKTSYIIANVTALGAGSSFSKYTGLSNNYNTTSVSRRLLTKAFGQATIRSLWHRLGFTYDKISSTVSMRVNYYFDNLVNFAAGGYEHASFGSASNHRIFWSQFRKNNKGRKANLVQLEILQTGVNNGMVLKTIHLEQSLLSHRKARTIEIMPNVVTTINRDISIAGNSGAGLDPLHSFVLPANSLRSNGDYVRVRYGGVFTTNDSDKRIQISFGGQVLNNVALFDQDSGVWDYDLTFVRTNATTVKVTGSRMWGTLSRDGAGTVVGNSNFAAIFTSAIVLDLNSNPMTLLVEAEGTITDDIQQGLSIIELSQQ